MVDFLFAMAIGFLVGIFPLTLVALNQLGLWIADKFK